MCSNKHELNADPMIKDLSESPLAALLTMGCQLTATAIVTAQPDAAAPHSYTLHCIARHCIAHSGAVSELLLRHDPSRSRHGVYFNDGMSAERLLSQSCSSAHELVIATTVRQSGWDPCNNALCRRVWLLVRPIVHTLSVGTGSSCVV